MVIILLDSVSSVVGNGLIWYLSKGYALTFDITDGTLNLIAVFPYIHYIEITTA
jgi:hypothetical protein